MKLSVSLPEEDVEFLDEYARTQGYDSRSAVVHKAVRLLRASELGNAYADAWDECVELVVRAALKRDGRRASQTDVALHVVDDGHAVARTSPRIDQSARGVEIDALTENGDPHASEQRYHL